MEQITLGDLARWAAFAVTIGGGTIYHSDSHCHVADEQRHDAESRDFLT